MTAFTTKISYFAFCVLSLCTLSCSSEEKPRPNILLVVVDTLRADHVTPYGYAQNPTTPNLQALVEQQQIAVVQNMFASSSWTKPSMATLFTGLSPAEHGVMRLTGAGSKLLDSHTLATEFAAAGYDTGCVMSNFLLTKRTGSGFDAGFDFYDDSTGAKPNPHSGSTAAEVTESGIQWLSERDSDRPWFLVLHYFDPHTSFEDHPDVDWIDPNYQGWVKGGLSNDDLRARESNCSSADQAALAAFYDEEIHAVDRQVQRVVEQLQAQQQWQETVMVFTADHGEELGERGHIGHTQTLFPELVQIPLLVRVPEAWKSEWALPEAKDGGFMLEQLYPAMLHVAGIDLPTGRTLAPPEYVSSEVDFQPVRKEHLEKYVQKRLVRWGDFTMIKDRRSGEEMLFDHRKDPYLWQPLEKDHAQWGVLRQRLKQHDWWEAR